MVKYNDLDPRYRNDPASVQRLVEGQHLDQRQFLHRYDVPVEGQRNRVHTYRQSVLDGTSPCRSELERQITLRVIDDLWAERAEQRVLEQHRAPFKPAGDGSDFRELSHGSHPLRCAAEKGPLPAH